jgi:hypothetical protein
MCQFEQEIFLITKALLKTLGSEKSHLNPELFVK